MALSIYWTALFVLAPLVALAVGHQIVSRRFLTSKPEDTTSARDADAKGFCKTFMCVYLIVMASEWLQSPYTYSLFRDEKQLNERSVALLYATTYASAAVSAFLTGYLADRFGRRSACLASCAIHSLASLSVKFDQLEVLIAGRVLSGISLNLLWTAFESWMVTEYKARSLEKSSLALSTMFSIMTTFNSITAIFAGILGHYIVLASGSKADPFFAGAVLDVCAAVLMLRTWNENRGAPRVATGLDDDGRSPESDADEKTHPERIITALKDRRVWVLSFASCCFEGAVFLIMFFWSELLQNAYDREHPEEEGGSIQYGVIFSTFMATVVLGSVLFNFITRDTAPSPTTEKDAEVGEVTPNLLFGSALFVSALSLLVAAFAQRELYLFLALLLFEACNGVYSPSMGFHRGMIVKDSGRALTYGLMNVPLFAFIIIALGTTGSTGAEHRQIVFIFLAMLLFIAALSIILALGDSDTHLGFQQVSDIELEDADAAGKEEAPGNSTN